MRMYSEYLEMIPLPHRQLLLPLRDLHVAVAGREIPCWWSTTTDVQYSLPPPYQSHHIPLLHKLIRDYPRYDLST